MRVEYSVENGVLFVEMEGELDHHVAKKLMDSIDKEITASASKKVALDFKRVTFMDSSGIAVVFGRYKKISAMGGSLYVINEPQQVKKVFELAGVYKLINGGTEDEDGK